MTSTCPPESNCAVQLTQLTRQTALGTIYRPSALDRYVTTCAVAYLNCECNGLASRCFKCHQPGIPTTAKIRPPWKGYSIDSQSSSRAESHNVGYEARQKAPKLWSLKRCNRTDLIEVGLYKMMHGFSDIPVSTYFQIATDSCTRGHTKRLIIIIITFEPR